MGELDERPLVLVVDDNVDQLIMCEALLELEGYAVIGATSVAMTRQVLRAATRDVDGLVADLSLGDGSAHDVLALLHELGQRPRVAVVVSGFDGTEYVEQTLAGGFDAHVTKPTAGDDLVALLAAGLRKQRPSGIRIADSCASRRPARTSRR